jgi:hypothetical protein
MRYDAFRRIADKALAFGQTEGFNFSGIGEPLLNPDIPRFVAYVSGHAETYLTTNGALLTQETAEALLEARLGQITVSFDGADTAAYERIMVGLDFDETTRALRRLVDLADGRVVLLANVAVSELTRGQLPAIRQRLADLGIHNVLFSLCHSRGGALRDETICHFHPPPRTQRCDIFADNTFVAWDGRVLACCQDLAGTAVLGDLTSMSMEELASIRRRILDEGVDFEMCEECDDIYRFYHDEPPAGASLSEWIYHLYESEDSRLAMLTSALRRREQELAKAKAQGETLESEIEQLRATIADYEQGRFIRFMNWLRAHGGGGRRAL